MLGTVLEILPCPWESRGGEKGKVIGSSLSILTLRRLTSPHKGPAFRPQVFDDLLLLLQKHPLKESVFRLTQQTPMLISEAAESKLGAWGHSVELSSGLQSMPVLQGGVSTHCSKLYPTLAGLLQSPPACCFSQLDSEPQGK